MRRRLRQRARRLRSCAATAALGTLLALVLAQCAVPQARPGRVADLHGVGLEVLGPWSGGEQQRFSAVLREFTRRTGAAVRYTSAGDAGVPVVLQRRIAADRPPDVALLPQPGLLASLADRGLLVLPSARVVAEVRRNYARRWQRLGAYAGHQYGVWFKAANKSLIWYNVGVFERAGVVPPAELASLLAVGRALTRAGVPAYAVSARDGWTLTDWFEDLYLQMAGPHRYDLLARHRLPWTDPSVLRTLREMSALLRPADIAGGTRGALRTGFEQSVQLTFGSPPAAAMVHEGDFVAGAITSRTSAEIGVEADVFPFPGRRQELPTVVGGGDIAVLLTASPGADEMLRFLATPAAASIWASRGGFLSPNLNLDLSVYPNEVARTMARRLLDAGDGFRFDLSDLAPAAFGGSDEAGMQRELRGFLVHPDVARTAARLEAAASLAYEGPRPVAAVTGRG